MLQIHFSITCNEQYKPPNKNSELSPPDNDMWDPEPTPPPKSFFRLAACRFPSPMAAKA